MEESKAGALLNRCFSVQSLIETNECSLYKLSFPEKLVVQSQFCRKGRSLFRSKTERIPSCTHTNQQNQGQQPWLTGHGCGNSSGFPGNRYPGPSLTNVHRIQEDVGGKLVPRNHLWLTHTVRNCCRAQHFSSRARIRSIKESSRPNHTLSSPPKNSQGHRQKHFVWAFLKAHSVLEERMAT